MSTIKSLVYVAVWLALTVLYFTSERSPDIAPTTPAGKARVLDWAVSDVTVVVIEAHGRRVSCRLSEGRWQVVYPVDYTVAGDLISAILSAVLDVAPVEVVGYDHTHDAEFGLAEPAGRLELTNAAGATVSLLLGARNPSQTAIYVRREGLPEVHLVGLTVQYYVDLALEGTRAPGA